VTLIYVRVRGAPKTMFGWLRNITNSAGIRLVANEFGGGAAQVNKIRRGGARRRRMGLTLVHLFRLSYPKFTADCADERIWKICQYFINF